EPCKTSQTSGEVLLMSYNFTITTPKKMSYEDFDTAVGMVDLIIDSQCEELQDNIEGSNYVYLEDTSSRGILFLRSDDKYEVEINYPNSREDWELGLKSIETLAEKLGESIEAEGKKYSLEEFRKKFNDKWIDEQFEFGIDTALKAASEQKDGGAIS